MNAVATWLARWTWVGMLWLMRRPWMRRLQRGSMRLVRPHRRAAAWEGLVKQNAFARRHGLRVLRFMYNLLVGSMIFTATYFFCLWLLGSGVLDRPGRP